MLSPREQIERAKKEARAARKGPAPAEAEAHGGVGPMKLDAPEQVRFRKARQRMRVHEGEETRYVFGGEAIGRAVQEAIERGGQITIIMYETR